jgi:hypothetical protein
MHFSTTAWCGWEGAVSNHSTHHVAGLKQWEHGEALIWVELILMPGARRMYTRRRFSFEKEDLGPLLDLL